MPFFVPVRQHKKNPCALITQGFAGELITKRVSHGEWDTNGQTTLEIKGGAVITAPFDYHSDYESDILPPQYGQNLNPAAYGFVSVFQSPGHNHSSHRLHS